MNEIYVSDSDEEVACAAAVYVLLSGEFLKMKKVKRKRRCWMVSLNKNRRSCNASDMLSDLKKEPSGCFEMFCRMSATDFEYLLSRIGTFIARRDTNMRESIPIHERLAVTLRFFATGDTYTSLSYLFRFSTQTVSRCVDEVCKAIIQELQDEVKLPKNEDEWLNIAQQCENQWNFPNCLGAIGGRHIIHVPRRSSTYFFNYKETFSVVLLALVDTHYCFTFVDIGCQGLISDEVFNNSSLFSKLQMGQLKLPPDRQLPSSDKMLPYVFLVDSACALSRHIMKPYPGILEKGSVQRMFNYRLSRAHRVVENIFGIMASVFRIFKKPMVLEPDKVSNVTLACVLLHNFMRRSPSSVSFYTPPGTFDTEVDGEVIPGSWRNDQSGMASFMNIQAAARKPGEEAKAIRNSFAEYFTTCGRIPCQDKYC